MFIIKSNRFLFFCGIAFSVWLVGLGVVAIAIKGPAGQEDAAQTEASASEPDSPVTSPAQPDEPTPPPPKPSETVSATDVDEEELTAHPSTDFVKPDSSEHNEEILRTSDESPRPCIKRVLYPGDSYSSPVSISFASEPLKFEDLQITPYGQYGVIRSMRIVRSPEAASNLGKLTGHRVSTPLYIEAVTTNLRTEPARRLFGEISANGALFISLTGTANYPFGVRDLVYVDLRHKISGEHYLLLVKTQFYPNTTAIFKAGNIIPSTTPDPVKELWQTLGIEGYNLLTEYAMPSSKGSQFMSSERVIQHIYAKADTASMKSRRSYRDQMAAHQECIQLCQRLNELRLQSSYRYEYASGSDRLTKDPNWLIDQLNRFCNLDRTNFQIYQELMRAASVRKSGKLYREPENHWTSFISEVRRSTRLQNFFEEQAIPYLEKNEPRLTDILGKNIDLLQRLRVVPD